MTKVKGTTAELYNWEEHILNQFQIPTANPDMAHRNFLDSWTEASRYFFQEKKYAPALARFHQSLNAMNTLSEVDKTSEDHYLTYHCLDMIGDCLAASHDYASAILYYGAAIKEIGSGIAENQTSSFVNFKKPFYHQEAYSNIYGKLAGCHNQVGKYIDAKSCYQLAVIADEKLRQIVNFDAKQIAHIESLNYCDFGINDLMMKEYKSAVSHFQKSAGVLLESNNKLDITEQANVAKAYYHAGKACLLSHQYEDAKTNFEKAHHYYQPLIKKTGDKVYLDLSIEIIENIAYTNIKIGKLEDASNNYIQAETTIESHKGDITGKRYRFNDRSRLEQSIEALKQFFATHTNAPSASKPVEVATTTSAQPTKIPDLIDFSEQTAIKSETTNPTPQSIHKSETTSLSSQPTNKPDLIEFSPSQNRKQDLVEPTPKQTPTEAPHAKQTVKSLGYHFMRLFSKKSTKPTPPEQQTAARYNLRNGAK